MGEPDDLLIYPGFGSWDRMRGGQVNIGGTRLCVADVIADLVHTGWGYIEENYEPRCGNVQLADLLCDLLSVEGEFARLLLTLAAAEHAENNRTEAVLDKATGGQGGLVNVSPWDPDATQLPPPWWETPDLAAPVIDQLKRCLAVLEGGELAHEVDE